MSVLILHWLAAVVLTIVAVCGTVIQAPIQSFLLLPPHGYTTNYYVDSVAGSDANNGTSSATPWQNLSKVQAIAGTLGTGLVPWTSIYLKRGSVWTGSSAYLFIDVSNVQILDYGAGALPKIDGRISMPNAAFALSSGQTITYQWQGTALNTAAENHNVFENGVRLKRQTTIAAVNANPGSYFAIQGGSPAVAISAGYTYGP